MNILILSCGTRNKLVSYFMHRKNGFDKVIVTDCSEYAPAFYVADKGYQVPRMDSPDYLDSILKICKQENINAILPLQEDELLLMAKNKYMFAKCNIQIIISEYEKVYLCRDKLECNNFLCSQDINAVPTWKAKEYAELLEKYKKIVLKPRYGAGSTDTYIVNEAHLAKAIVETEQEEMIVQPYIRGKEFGVDIYVDMLTKEVTDVFIKEKIRMRAGETEKSVSVKNKDIANLAIHAASSMGLIGPVDMDILEQNGEYFILEINPRFGGGYPHAYECGINFPKNICQNTHGIANNQKLFEYAENIKSMKYTDVLIVGE